MAENKPTTIHGASGFVVVKQQPAQSDSWFGGQGIGESNLCFIDSFTLRRT
jgi:hypothetical protein